MTTLESPVKSEADANIDVSTIWREAINHYEKVTTVKIKSLVGASNVDDILSDIHERETEIKAHRHDGSKLDKFRTLVRRSLNVVDQLSNVVGLVVSTFFPPSTAIFTAIRYLINTTKAVSADYDRITEFFEDLDLYLHRLKILETQIPLVVELKVAIAQVLTSVLVLCGICVKYVKMNRLSKTFRNLISGEDDELIKAYADFHKMVEQEQGAVRNATLASVVQSGKTMKIMQVDMRKNLAITKHTDRNTKDLMDSTGRIYDRLEVREAAFERDEILGGLSLLSFHNKQRDVFEKHHRGTGQWLLTTDRFQEWFKGGRNSTLWCPGDPGVGKTVMTSLVITYVAEATRGKKAAMAYVYCDYKDTRTQSAIGLFSSITRQLAEQISPLPPEVKAFRDKDIQERRNPTDGERISLLRSICLFFQTTYVFIDALDTCPETNREKFLRLIKQIEHLVRVFVTSRPHVDLHAQLTNVSQVDIRTSCSDVKAYLKYEIDTNSRLSKFVTKYPELEEEIVSSINEKAAGMFLFAHLQISRLCKQTSPKMLRENLNALPTGVFASYEDDINRIDAQSAEGSQLAKRALSYVFCARRPLNVEELRHALATEVGGTGLDETALPEIETLLNFSAGLIRLDQKSGTIRLVHSTLQEYLEVHGWKVLPDPETMITRTCLTYLSFEVFDSGPCKDAEALEQRLQEYRFLDYASHNWGHHAAGNQCLMDLVLTYLNDSQKLSCSVQVSHLALNQRRNWQSHFPEQFGPLHVSAYWGLDYILPLLFGKGIDVDSRDGHGETALQIAAKRGHESTVRFLLENQASINIENHNGETALYWAARNGQKTIVQLLLMNGANVFTKDDQGWTALDWAVVGGKSDIGQHLLEHGVNTESIEEGRNTALYLAAGEGHEDTVQMLLDNGANVNAKDWIGSTAMDWAVSAGHERTVQALLRNGANLNSRDEYGNTALHWAVQHEAIAQLLLENVVDVNAKNGCGQTALCWAVRDGRVTVAQLLVRHAADVNAQDKYGCTALHGAALKGRKAMIQLLLEQGADPNAEDKHGWTALHAAALKRHKGVVQVLLEKADSGQAILDWAALQQENSRKHAFLMDIAERKAEGSTVLTGLRAAVQEKHISRLQLLLEEGADVNAKDVGGWTGLILAAGNGDKEAVQLLLRNGADTNISGRREWPALHWASRSGKEVVVQLLVDNGAEINASKNGWTPMLLAAKRGHMSIVQFLVEHGADVNTEDYHGRNVLHWAARYGRKAMVSLLLEKGAEFNAVDCWGRTALIWAIENKQQAVTLMLLAIGADIEVKTRDGSTALHVAVFLQEEVIVQQLLEKGASLEAETRDKFTALHVAALVGCEAVVQQLLKKGVDLEAKIRWHWAENSDEYEDGTIDIAKVTLLSQHLRRLVFDQKIIADFGAEAQQELTARQLAAIGGHIAVQRLLGNLSDKPR